MTDHLFELIVGAYIFAAGAYIFGFKILTMLMGIRRLVSNHHEHRFGSSAFGTRSVLYTKQGTML